MPTTPGLASPMPPPPAPTPISCPSSSPLSRVVLPPASAASASATCRSSSGCRSGSSFSSSSTTDCEKSQPRDSISTESAPCGVRPFARASRHCFHAPLRSLRSMLSSGVGVPGNRRITEVLAPARNRTHGVYPRSERLLPHLCRASIHSAPLPLNPCAPQRLEA